MGEYAELSLGLELVHAMGDTEVSKPLSRHKANVFFEHRKAHDKVWKTLDGTVILMTSMSNDHIAKCLEMLEKNGQTATKAYQGLKRELEKR